MLKHVCWEDDEKGRERAQGVKDINKKGRKGSLKSANRGVKVENNFIDILESICSITQHI